MALSPMTVAGPLILQGPLSKFGSLTPVKPADLDGNWVHLASATSGRLRVLQSDAHLTKQACGPWTRFEITPCGDGVAVRIKANKQFLGIDVQGQPTLSEVPFAVAKPVLDTCEALPDTAIDAKVTISSGDSHNQEPPEILQEHSLSAEQIGEFRKNGYIILQQAVPRELWHEALRAINHSLGKPEYHQQNPRHDPDGFRLNSLILKSPALRAALNSLIDESKMGPLHVKNAKGWVTLNYPQSPKDLATKTTWWHLDGMAKVGEVNTFSLLVGVALSDQTSPDAGNLGVHPRSHVRNDILQWIHDWSKGEKAPQPKLGNEIKPVLLAPGDVVIAHRFLAHSATANHSPNIRYQVYFRLCPQDWSKFNQNKLDPWAEFQQ